MPYQQLPPFYLKDGFQDRNIHLRKTPLIGYWTCLIMCLVIEELRHLSYFLRTLHILSGLIKFYIFLTSSYNSPNLTIAQSPFTDTKRISVDAFGSFMSESLDASIFVLVFVFILSIRALSWFMVQ